MFSIIAPLQIRPNRLTDKKDKKYHVNFARWSIGTLNHPLYKRHIVKTMINWSFYKGNQWILDEDLEAFFLDETGGVRNRLKLTKNLITPMVDQYIGNTVRLSYNARASTTSDFVINRRERELNKMKFFYQVGQAIPDFKETIANRVPMGETPQETEELFDSVFDDDFAETINDMLSYMEKDINIDEIKKKLSEYIALSGIGIYKGYEQNGKYIGKEVDPLFFYWDLSARKSDLSDAEHMGEWYMMDTPSLFERFQNITPKDRQALEQWSVDQSIYATNRFYNFYLNYNSSGRIPVYESYWRDSEEQEYGCVLDRFGYPMLTRINHESSEYKTKDCIKPPTKELQDALKGGRTAKVYVDVLRYCIFVPREVVGSNVDEDIVLEWGEVPYQEKQMLDPSSVGFPYKCYTWIYDRGEIISPIDNAISPQRFINRLHSVAESHINNARGTGTVIDSSAVDERGGEEAVARNINSSKPIFVDGSRVGGVQNAVGSYGTGINTTINNIFNIASTMQQSLGDTTGVNEAMVGTQGGSDALVGVVQAQIQRGSLVQEKFYWALTSIMGQAYQHMATVGKRIYRDNPRRLAIMAGDGGAKIIKITEDMANEDFRVFIKRTQAEVTQIDTANNMLLTFIQLGFIDQTRFTLLYNRATPDQVMKSVREYAIMLEQAKREQSKAQQQNAIAAQQQAAQMQNMRVQMYNQQRSDAMAQDERDKEHELELKALEGDKRIEKDMMNNLFKP